MMHFTVETFQPTDSCQKCCCEKIHLQPGTTSKLSVGYAPWAAPIGQLHCEPQFSIEPLETCVAPMSGNVPPDVMDGIAVFDTPINTALTDDLKTQIVNIESDPLTFVALPFHGPKNGKLALNSDGTFTYTPFGSYTGEDRFFASVNDGVNAPVVFEVAIGVGITLTSAVPTPHISVGRAGIVVDQRYYNVSFPVTVSPAARSCEVWRLTVLQGALDCECVCFTRSDCFDIGVAKC